MKRNIATVHQRIENSFAEQGLMRTLGARLVSVEIGKVVVECPFHQGLSQQDGFFHAGVITSIVDSACGYAALTTMPEGNRVLSVEFKVNLLRPAKSEKIIAVGEVLKAGKTLTVCEGYVYDSTMARLFAKMTATMISLPASS